MTLRLCPRPHCYGDLKASEDDPDVLVCHECGASGFIDGGTSWSTGFMGIRRATDELRRDFEE
jgi:hypothetical protein